MSDKPGFDIENVDQEKGFKKQQEMVNRTVLSKQVRILFVSNPNKLPLREVVKRFSTEIIRYDNSSDASPLGWAKSAGGTNESTCFRAEMSSPFWDYFLEKGKRCIAEYNRKHKCNVKLLRDHSVKVADLESLSLYLRKKIREYCHLHHFDIPEVQIKNGYLSIKSNKMPEALKIKSTLLAIKLGWSYHDWSGIPIKELLTDNEAKDFTEGKIKWCSLKLESILHIDVSAVSDLSQSNSEDSRISRKREATQEETSAPKMARRVNEDEEKEE
ncbi:hypothetical protein OSTOST_16983 [Ostertagia ostertagi]